ncbi:MAG TPA: hypothetical protein VFU76_15565 [Terriglobales bacterium]|nr:hypothetical protein [Terriglobales bacterium]
MAFSFLRTENLVEHAGQLRLISYAPRLEVEGLVAGVDNLRHDVFLSPLFTEVARNHLARLIAIKGDVQDMVTPEPVSRPEEPPPWLIVRPQGGKTPPPPPPPEFKTALADLLVASLNRAKNEHNLSVDLLARLAVIKFLRAELQAQFAVALERCRTKLKSFEGPRQAGSSKAVELRERVATFQLAKKAVLRKVAQEMFQTLRDVEKEILARTRRALFGDIDPTAYALLINRLMFTDDGRDDYINAEHYVMLGNFEKDVDRFQTLLEITRAFLVSLGFGDRSGEEPIDPLLNVPENAHELVAGGSPDESTQKGKSQKILLNAWLDLLEREGVMDPVIAAYEAVALLPEYSPPINAQQLKNALVNKAERQRVEQYLEEHGRLSRANLDAAVRRVGSYRGAERAKFAGRFLRDFIRYHRDLRSLEALNSALDHVNLITNDKLRELSSINNTLYEFLLSSELKPSEGKVVCHCILKADVRDSTTLTRTLLDRGLNPASYFSLNFYDPINKLLPKYAATKVFIEGDAVILALFEREGERAFPVARTCVLAREMIEIVRAYNEKSKASGLPTLELGIGISFQDSAPMYLLDGSSRIMISKALNESDRLSSCNKGARRVLGDGTSLFNVYSFKTVEDEDTGGNPDEFLMRYNVGGIHINQAAFDKLQQEISLQRHELELPTLWNKEKVRLYTGLVPLGGDIFHRIVIREGIIPRIEASDFSFKEWTGRRYYEICTNQTVFEYCDNAALANAGKSSS